MSEPNSSALTNKTGKGTTPPATPQPPPQSIQEAELQLIISQTPFMLTRCSADLRYLFVSPAYAEMLGRPAAEIAGKSILEVVGEEGFTTILPHIEKVLGGEIVEYETDVAFHGVGVRNLHVIYSPDRN